MAHTRMARSIGLLALAFAALSAFASTSRAHDRTTSYSSWRLSQRRAEVVLRINEVDLAYYPWAAKSAPIFDAALARYALENLAMLSGEQACEAIVEPHRMDARPGRIAIGWSVSCPGDGPLSIHSDFLFDTLSSHLHFVKLYNEDGGAERVLSDMERTWRLESEAGLAAKGVLSTSMASYWLLGVEHIATGCDHLVFLLALLLTGGAFRSLVKVVTGFTVGHSVTLMLASLGLVRPELGPIEALIGLSIVLVSVENVWLIGPRGYSLPTTMAVLLLLLALGSAHGVGRISSISFLGLAIFVVCYYPLLRRSSRAGSARWALALLFGLIHGFGFASALRTAELSAERLPIALISFNVGVEFGQLVIVAMVWPFLRLAVSRWGEIVIEAGSAFTLGLGAYWLVERMYVP